MTRAYTALQFVSLLKSRIGNCSSIELRDRNIPVKHAAQKLWVALRGDAGGIAASLFEEDELAKEPFQLVSGGSIGLYIRIRERQDKTIDVASYRIDVRVPDNSNGVSSLRFENDNSGKSGPGWDDDLQDNPEHPLNHLHINYLRGVEANKCRMPTGVICPIVLMRAVDYWYQCTFVTDASFKSQT